MTKEKDDITKITKSILSSVNKGKKKNKASLYSDVDADVKYWLSTGSFLLDNIMGKGLPSGRIIEIVGDVSSGKTTLALSILAEVQRQGGVPCLIETEHALEPSRAEVLGLDLDNIVFSQPDSLEEVLDLIERLCDSAIKEDSLKDKPLVIVWDSIAATPTQTELDNPLDNKNPGLHARIMSAGFRKLTDKISDSNIYLVCLNQLKKGFKTGWGPPDYISLGGEALKFHSTVRVMLLFKKRIKEPDEEPTGQEIKVQTIKNKVYSPFKTCILRLLFDTGIDDDMSVFYHLKDNNLIQHKGGAVWVLKLEDRKEEFTKDGWSDVFESNKKEIGNLIKNVKTKEKESVEGKE